MKNRSHDIVHRIERTPFETISMAFRGSVAPSFLLLKKDCIPSCVLVLFALLIMNKSEKLSKAAALVVCTALQMRAILRSRS